MSGYSMSLTFSNIRSVIVMIADIFVMWLIFYYALRIVRNNARTIQIFKGIILVVVIDGLANILGLTTLEFFTNMFMNWGFLAIIIIFQPEIRSLLERIGKSNVFSRITTLTGSEKENLVDNIVTAVMLLSKDQTGALISIEQSHSLNDFIATGTALHSDVTAELLTSIFVTSTPLHDGAVIIQGDKIACASAYFPPTNLDLPTRYGARHRAAIGISEITDCVTIVVSEETGAVSITEGGRIIPVNREQLRDYLLRVICGEATEVKAKRQTSSPERKSSLVSKLAVRKQNGTIEEKVHVEAVKPAAEKNLAGDAHTAADTARIHAQADEEAAAAEIKLPHKKKRPKPSYPKQQESKSALKEEKPKRMTPAEVQAAREASLNSLRHEEVKAHEPIINEEDHKYDTSKLDISRLVGFNDELNQQFKMVDELDDKGGKNDD